MCENTHISPLQFLLKKLFILQMYINAFCSMLKLFSLLFFFLSVTSENQSLQLFSLTSALNLFQIAA